MLHIRTWDHGRRPGRGRVIEPLVRMQSGRVAGKIEDLDLALAGFQPCLDQLGVVPPEIVENEEYLAILILDERFEKRDPPKKPAAARR